MARLSLFTYHVILHPEEVKKGEKQDDSQLIIKPTTVLAKDQQSLAFKVTREIDEKYVDMFDRIEVGIAPFNERTRKVTDSSLTIIGPGEGLLANEPILTVGEGNMLDDNNAFLSNSGTAKYDNQVPFTLTGSSRVPAVYFNAAQSLADANV